MTNNEVYEVTRRFRVEARGWQEDYATRGFPIIR